MNHHPNLKLSHHCTHGAVLTAEISTYVSGGILPVEFSLGFRVEWSVIVDCRLLGIIEPYLNPKNLEKGAQKKTSES